MRRYSLTRSASFLLLLLTVLIGGNSAFAQGQPNLDVTLVDLAGEDVTLSDVDTSLVLINFWATWCTPCVDELPHLQRLQDTYGAQGLTVLAISTDATSTEQQVRDLVTERGWTMPILLDPEGIANGLNLSMMTPYTMILQDGQVVYTHEGYSSGDEAEYEATVRSLLGLSE